jgi:hypothetical protein
LNCNWVVTSVTYVTVCAALIAYGLSKMGTLRVRS